MSMLRNSKAESRMWSMFCSDPVSRLSTQITRCPCDSRCSQRCDPRNPAPPVTTQVALIRAPMLQACSHERPLHAFFAISALSPQSLVHFAGERSAFPDNNIDVYRSDLDRWKEAQRVEGAAGATGSDAARKRVAVEMVAKHGLTLR